MIETIRSWRRGGQMKKTLSYNLNRCRTDCFDVPNQAAREGKASKEQRERFLSIIIGGLFLANRGSSGRLNPIPLSDLVLARTRLNTL